MDYSSSIPMPPERDEDRAHEEREQRALDDEMEAKRRASGCSPEELVDLERRIAAARRTALNPDQIIDECMYVSYATQRDQAPQVSPERWAKLFKNAPALEARYQAELAIMKAQVSAEYPL